MSYKPTSRQFLAWIFGLAAWAIWALLRRRFLTGESPLLDNFDFLFPLMIGGAVGWANVKGGIASLVILALGVGLADAAFVLVVSGPLDPTDLSFAIAFTFDAFFASFVMSQSVRVSTLTQQLQIAHQSLTTTMPSAKRSRAKKEKDWSEKPPAITSLLGAITALLTAIAALIHQAHS
jgi:hypothetical protein